jgi:FkbM family methyltransferase
MDTKPYPPDTKQYPPGLELFDVRSIPSVPRPEGEAQIRRYCESHYLGGHETLARCLGRYKMFLDTRDLGFAPHIIMDGFWEYWITQFIVGRIEPGFCVLDIGANFGYYALLLSDLIGSQGRCIAVEPNPSVAAKLRKSLSVNGFAGRTDVKEVALGHQSSGTVRFFVPREEPKNGQIVPSDFDAGERGQLIDVGVTTVDDLCASMDRLDFIKIDAEGAEDGILAGMERTLRRLTPSLLLEFNAGRGHDGERLVRRLQEVYADLCFVDYDAKLKFVTPADLVTRNVGEDWMLFFRGGQRQK